MSDPVQFPRAVETGGRRRTIAETLVALARDRAGFFRDPDGRPYADIEVRGPRAHREIVRVRSRAFRDWIGGLYYASEGRSPGGSPLTDAVDTLSGLATYRGETRSVEVRYARHGAAVYVDLGDDRWRVVEIDAEGWRILDQSPVAFVRPRGMRPLPVPVAGGRLDVLRDFVNVADDDQVRLLVGWLVGAVRPEGPYLVLVLTGEQDSAKTTQARVLRSLLDPNMVGDRTLPRDERSLAVAAGNAWVASFDNLSTLADWQSDALARLSTGAGFGTRELYSDDEEYLVHVARPIILNGIGSVATRPDLMDRAIVLDLAPIPETGRRPENEFYGALELARPALLGALLDAVSVAIAGEDDVRLDRLPRMADATRWITAAEPALGWPTGSFVAAYRANRDQSRRIALDVEAIVPPIRNLVAATGTWSGTPTELFDALSNAVDEAVRKRSDWPKNANQLGVALARIAPSLRTVDGIEFRRPRTGRSGRTYVLAQVRNSSSPSSPSSPSSVNDPPMGDDGVTTGDDAPSSVVTAIPVQGDDGDDGDDDLQTRAAFGGEGSVSPAIVTQEPLFGPPVEASPVDPAVDIDAALAWAFSVLDDEDPAAGGWFPLYRIAEVVAMPLGDIEKALKRGGVRYRPHRGKGPGEVEVWQLTARAGDA